MGNAVIRELIGFYVDSNKIRRPLFRNLSVNTNIRQREMNKHIVNHMTARNGGLDQYGRPAKSYWRTDLSEQKINEIVQSSIGKGRVYSMPDGSYREIILYSTNIGQYVDKAGNITKTSKFIIHYSSNGVHAYPCNPKSKV